MNIYHQPAYPPIHPDTLFGENVRIGHYVVIEENCEIGDNTFVGEFVVLRPFTKIGKNCFIGNHCNIAGWCEIGDSVNLRQFCNVTKGAKIGDLVFMGPGVMSMNDRHIVYKRPEGFTPKPYIIKRGVRIGSGAIILPGVTVEENAVIGAGAVVTKDVPMGMVVMGVPAKIVRAVPLEEYV